MRAPLLTRSILFNCTDSQITVPQRYRHIGGFCTIRSIMDVLEHVLCRVCTSFCLRLSIVQQAAEKVCRSQKVSTKRIFLITCNDNPNANNAVLQRNANVRAKVSHIFPASHHIQTLKDAQQDLEDLGIVIELFPVQINPETPFEISKFYQHLAAIPKQIDGDVDIAPASVKYQEMQNKILRREAKKRTAFRVSFKIGEGLEISVKGWAYRLVMLGIHAKCRRCS